MEGGEVANPIYFQVASRAPGDKLLQVATLFSTVDPAKALIFAGVDRTRGPHFPYRHHPFRATRDDLGGSIIGNALARAMAPQVSSFSSSGCFTVRFTDLQKD